MHVSSRVYGSCCQIAPACDRASERMRFSLPAFLISADLVTPPVARFAYDDRRDRARSAPVRVYYGIGVRTGGACAAMPKWLVTMVVSVLAAIILAWSPMRTHASGMRLAAPKKPACCCAHGQCHMADCYGNKALADHGKLCCCAYRPAAPTSGARTDVRSPAPSDVLPIHRLESSCSFREVVPAPAAAALRSLDPTPLDRPPRLR
jgi:hypothetical protein